MAGLVPAIHERARQRAVPAIDPLKPESRVDPSNSTLRVLPWMAGTSPAMTPEVIRSDEVGIKPGHDGQV